MTSNCTASINCSSDPLGPSLVDLCRTPQFVVFLSLLNQLVLSNEKISGRCERVKPIKTPDDEYDFVVIGAGGSGSVVTGRLSENPDWKVLVLEAGSDEPAIGQIPLFFLTLLGTEVDWNYRTTNETHACLAGNGSCSVFTGKMLGGSTSHNGMVYIRGNPTDYNNWAEQGNDGWTWEEVEPFFKKAEDNGEIKRVGRKHHGTGGPLSVERFPYLPSFGDSLLAAATEAGFGVSENLNGEQITGFSIAQTTSKNGVRRSSARAYLWPARNRKNLHVSLKSQATRVIIENDTAVGVEYYQDGQLKRVRVSREVVLSAGAIESPHILLLSGIGAKEHLESMGVEVVKDLPGVGNNFHDQVTYGLTFTINKPDRYNNDYDIAAQYLVDQTGPLSGIGLGTLIANLATSATSPRFPDSQLQVYSSASPCGPGKIGALQSPKKRTIGMRLVNLHPKSRGRISLASKDPLKYPVIWGNFLSDPRDVDVLVEAIEMGLKLSRTEALRAHNFTLSTTPIKACSNYTFLSSEYWACAIRQEASPEIHHGGSCKMGPSSDPMAVVDPKLRVHGIKGLRVADNSIMPQVTSGNTAAPAMMIGERAADFINKDWAQGFAQ